METREVNGHLPPNGCDSGTDSSTFDITTSTDSDQSSGTVTSVTSQSDSQSQIDDVRKTNGHNVEGKDLDEESLSLDLSKSDSQGLDLSISSLDKETIQDETLTNGNKLKLPKFDGPDWYMNSCFQRYWQHYYHCMDWCQKHKNVARNLAISPGGPVGFASTASTRGTSYKWPNMGYPSRENPYNVGARHRGRKRMKGRGRGHIPQTTERTGDIVMDKSVNHDEEQQVSDNDSEVFEMEITEDMVEFFARSEQHKKERGRYIFFLYIHISVHALLDYDGHQNNLVVTEII